MPSEFIVVIIPRINVNDGPQIIVHHISMYWINQQQQRDNTNSISATFILLSSHVYMQNIPIYYQR